MQRDGVNAATGKACFRNFVRNKSSAANPRCGEAMLERVERLNRQEYSVISETVNQAAKLEF
jgi:hypothetical protein